MENNLIKKIDEEIKITETEIKQSDDRKRLLSVFENYEGADRVISFRELNALLEFQPESRGFKTQIPKLDFMTEGFKEGNVIIVSGTTGSGKTTLLQSFVCHCDKEMPVLFFTFEVPAKQFLSKFSELPEFAFLPKQHHASKMEWLESRILEGIAKHQTKIVMIDHLHYLLDLKMLTGNTSLFIGQIMRELKRIAIENEIIIFLVAHTKKTKFSQDEMPDLTALRDSGMVACEADFVLFIDRKMSEDRKSFDNKAMLYLAKNRWNGNCGWVSLIYANNSLTEEVRETYDYTK